MRLRHEHMLKELEPLIAQYARSRETMFKSLALLDEAQVRELLPGREWSVQDTLAHLATNQDLMTDLLSEIISGSRRALADDFDNQRFNDDQVARGRAKSVQALRADLDSGYARLIAVLETVTAETIHRRGTHPAVGDADVKEFFLGMYAHHEMHCRDVVEQARRLKKAVK